MCMIEQSFLAKLLVFCFRTRPHRTRETQSNEHTQRSTWILLVLCCQPVQSWYMHACIPRSIAVARRHYIGSRCRQPKHGGGGRCCSRGSNSVVVVARARASSSESHDGSQRRCHSENTGSTPRHCAAWLRLYRASRVDDDDGSVGFGFGSRGLRPEGGWVDSPGYLPSPRRSVLWLCACSLLKAHQAGGHGDDRGVRLSPRRAVYSYGEASPVRRAK